MIRNALSRERLEDLLVARATEGLDAADLVELERLLSAQGEYGWDDFDGSAAALDLAFTGGRVEPMPAAVRDAVHARATEFLSRPRAADPAPAAPVVARGEARDRWGWYAAAAALLLAVFAWTGDGSGDAIVPLDVARLRLIEGAGDLVRATWSPVDERYAGVTGDVVWSPSRQEGYMRLRGLPSNDPARVQYQLWIVAPQRDEEPVDGGVFDIPAGRDEVVVPIDSKLHVDDAQAFVLTAEHPGGVVVSQGPHLLLAK